jgi:two-component system NtrC family response regulator
LARLSVAGDAHVRGDLGPAQPILDPTHFPSIKNFRAREMADLDRRYLSELLKISRGSMDRACVLSGLSRARLYALLHQYGLTRHPSGG